MDTNDLFDRMASELAASGVVENAVGATRTLSLDGTAFARLVENGAQVYLPAGSPAREDALALASVTQSADGWITVSADDVASWPTLFQQALIGLRG